MSDTAQSESKEPALDAKQRAGLGFGFFFVSLITCVAASIVAGGATAYWLLANQDHPASVAVIDVDDAARMAGEMASNGGDSDKAAVFVSAVIRARAQELANLGIVVIDKSSVVAVPAGLEVDIRAAIRETSAAMDVAGQAPVSIGARLPGAAGK